MSCQKIFLRHNARYKLSIYSYVLFCILCVCYFIIYARFNRIPKVNLNIATRHFSPSNTIIVSHNNDTKKLPMKYILLWTNPKRFPFIFFGKGNSVFKKKSCKWTNCYVTADRNYLGSYREFEVIVFNGPQLPLMLYNRDWPRERLPRQKYVFANIESAANVPIRTNVFNGFFNWTWTYKLNSDAVWGYVIIRNANNTVVGPRADMQWMNEKDIDPINKSLILSLQTKYKAAAWMCSTKDSLSRRETFVTNLQHHLKKYGLKVDVYGECGDYRCPKQKMAKCLENIKKNYFFYLAFENSFSDDYVTEKVLYALNQNTVPIVYGGANYSRFLPPGSYLDAAKLGPKKLAQTIADFIKKPLEYLNFFSWKNHYSFYSPHSSPDTDSYCNFCAMINNKTLMNNFSSYENFNAWWMDKVMKIL